MKVASTERILVATLNIATAVSAGERKGRDRYAPPSALRIEGGQRQPETVDETVSAGVMMLAQWAGRQKGPASAEWPEKLQGWLDDWEDDFRRSDAGDETAGFRRLVGLLGAMSQAIGVSSVLQ